MKKFKALSAFIVLFSALAFTSCDTEPVDSELIGNNPENPNPNNPNNPNNPGNPVSGSYMPLAVGNEWTYDNGSTTLINSTEVIDGVSWYRIDSAVTGGGTGTVWIRKVNGSYYSRITASVDGTTVLPFEYLSLREDLEAGESWEQDVTQETVALGMNIDVNYHFVNTILEKGVTEVLNGVTYNDVLKLKIDQTYSIMGIPSSTIVTEAWYARNIGPIKSISLGTTTSLVDYTLN